MRDGDDKTLVARVGNNGFQKREGHKIAKEWAPC